MEGTKLTGDDNVPAGHVAFKAAIGSKESIPGYTMYPPDLGVRVGYKGKGRVAKAKYTEPRCYPELCHYCAVLSELKIPAKNGQCI